MNFDIRNSKNQQIDKFFSRQEAEPEPLETPDELMLESPHDFMLEEGSREEGTLFEWQAPEFEKHERSSRWYLTISLVLAAIITYAVVSNNPIMAITFVLIGAVGYIYLQKEPQILTFRITRDGVMAGNELFEFENIDSFWIYYNPPTIKTLSLKTRGRISPLVHIFIHQEDPTEIRRILLEHIPEEKQEPTMVDTIEKILHL